ncbi:centromere protein U isoform X2 [Mixophyes fleayi]
MKVHADSSSILMAPVNAMQEDVGEESFNPPLHSTAVYTDEDEDELLAPEQVSARQISPIPPTSQEESIKPSNAASKSQTVATPEHATRKPDAAIDKSQRESAGKAKSQRKKRNTSSKGDQKKTKSVKSPDDEPRSTRNLNELDIVLFEFEKIITLYRETVDTDVCLRAIDGFFHSLKEQFTASISDVQKLKELKKKNAQMQSEIGRKRKRLIEVKSEIIQKQPRLKQLQRECSEQEEQQESLKNARAFLANLGQLKEDYMKFKAENPNNKETYGVSSLPALLVQAENILKAEHHFHNVNTRLQCFIDKAREEG